MKETTPGSWKRDLLMKKRKKNYCTDGDTEFKIERNKVETSSVYFDFIQFKRFNVLLKCNKINYCQ